MDESSLVDVLLEASTLKWVPRAGWRLRGVPNGESVAEHSFGVAFAALAVACVHNVSESPDGRLDLEAVLSIALLHDLAEARLTDLPASAVRLLPGESKRQAEEAALKEILGSLPCASQLVALWRQFEGASTAEGRLVRDVDKLEMMAQCLRYEQAGYRALGEFWQVMDDYAWHFPLCAQLYRQLRAMRPEFDRQAESR